MTTEQKEAKRRAEVMLAFANGASIEWRIADGGVVWGEDDSPSWEWKTFDYRVNHNPVVNWDAMPAWANAVAKCHDDRWAWFAVKPPSCVMDEIVGMWGHIPPEYAPKYAGTKPWYKLIIERPKK